MMMFLLILLLVFALGGGGWGYSRHGVLGGIGPIGVALVVVAVLYFTGNLWA